MIVLGLDTATASSAVALRLSDASTIEARDDPRPGEHPGHATRLLALARELLETAGVGWPEIERIAVGVGPGTFTGLRVGIATARGLAQSLAIELAGVSSLQALARAALGADADPGPERRTHAILAVIDARRGEVFAAAYRHVAKEPPRELAAAQALAPERLAALVAHAQQESAGTGLGAWLAVGDGAVRYRAELEAGGIPVAVEGSPLHRVSAGAICELGALAPAVGSQEIVPDYRRRADAELALASAAAAGASLR